MTFLDLSSAKSEAAQPVELALPARLVGLARSLVPSAVAAGSGAAATALGTAAGLWYLPFAAGLVIGVWGRRRPALRTLATAALAAGGGWALVFLWNYSQGADISGTARVVASLVGLPPLASLMLLATLLLAAVQAAAGCTLGRTASRAAGADAPSSRPPADPQPAAGAPTTG
jgi:hypothetical protein